MSARVSQSVSSKIAVWACWSRAYCLAQVWLGLVWRQNDVKWGLALAQLWPGLAQHGTGSRRLEKLRGIFLITLGTSWYFWLPSIIITTITNNQTVTRHRPTNQPLITGHTTGIFLISPTETILFFLSSLRQLRLQSNTFPLAEIMKSLRKNQWETPTKHRGEVFYPVFNVFHDDGWPTIWSFCFVCFFGAGVIVIKT